MSRAEAKRVLYLSHATSEVYAIIREQAGPGVELLTLGSDDEDERRTQLVRAQVVIVASTPLTRTRIEAAPALELVHHQGVGYHDTIDVAALAERGVPLAITPSGTTTGVAEHTVLLILAVLRRLAFADSELRQGRWHVNSLRPESRELAGMTVGYVGMGRIGQATAQRLRSFETTGLYVDDLAPLPAERERALGLTRVGLDALLPRADVVTLHTPLTPQTRRLVDRSFLTRMKPSAILINTARGPVVDEAALVGALASGHLGGAGLDVFASEPPATDHPLFAFRNVVLTPHISAGTRDALQTKMRAVFANIARFDAGEPLENEVELAAYARAS